MYWDLPPLERKKAQDSPASKSEEGERERGFAEDEEEEDEEENDEGKPLMRSQDLMGSYGSVVTPGPLGDHAASNATPNHISPPPSPPPSETQESPSSFKNLSISRGKQHLIR